MATTVFSSAGLCQSGLLGRRQGVDCGLLHHQSKVPDLFNVFWKGSATSNFPLSSNVSTRSCRGRRIFVPRHQYTSRPRIIHPEQQQQHRMKSVVCSSTRSSNIHWQGASVTKEERSNFLHQKGCIIWLTGLSGSGKSTVAFTVDKLLKSIGNLSYVLDGDNLRHGLCKDLKFSAADRQENVRRVGETAKLFADAGLITCVSLISPYKRDRDCIRELVPTGEFIEVYMNVPLEVCERRDCKGLYKLARAGVIKGFTGVDDPYEAPLNPEINLKDSDDQGAAIPAVGMAWTIVDYLSDNGYLYG